MKFCCQLKLPVEFNPQQYHIPDLTKNHHVRIDKKSIARDMHDLLESLGLSIVAGEYFYTAPYMTLAPHCDTLQITNVVKLNWMYGGEGSTMDWYQLHDGARLPEYETIIKTRFSVPDPNDIKLVHRDVVGRPSLVNVGQVHGVTNGPHPRHVHCIVLGDGETNDRLTWSKAEKIFEKYVV